MEPASLLLSGHGGEADNPARTWDISPHSPVSPRLRFQEGVEEVLRGIYTCACRPQWSPTSFLSDIIYTPEKAVCVSAIASSSCGNLQVTPRMNLVNVKRGEIQFNTLKEGGVGSLGRFSFCQSPGMKKAQQIPCSRVSAAADPARWVCWGRPLRCRRNISSVNCSAEVMNFVMDFLFFL